MQPQMNPSSPPGPQGVPMPMPTPAPHRPRSFAGPIVLVLLVAAAATGYFLWRRNAQAAQQGGPGGIAGIRTTVVAMSSLQRTLRLTGVTAAEKYASIIAPQLRGSRPGGGGGMSMSGGGGMMVVTVTTPGGGGGGRSGGGGGGGGQSSGGQSSSSSSSSSAATSSTSTSTASSGSASSGTSSSMSTFRGATNRFGSSAATTSSSSTSAASSSSSSSSASSSSSSGGGGGGGGGGDSLSGGANDFMQVLQSVVKPGSYVKKGDVVAQFDPQYQILRLDDYKATVEQSERQLRTLDTNIEVQRKAYQQSIEQAKGTVEKAKLDIKTTPVRSVIQAETLKLALEEAEAQLKQLQSQIPFQETSMASQRRGSEISVDVSRVELKRAERNVALMGISAPMDGMLVMESMMRGSEFSQIQQGDQLYPGQMFARIVDPRSMLVSASVNQADVEMVRVGSKAILRFDAYPDLELAAHVISIAAITKPGGPRGSFVKEIPVFLKLDQMDARVIPDLSVSADIVVQSGAPQLVAPLESIFRDDSSSKPYVFVKTAQGFQKRDVEIGLRNNIAASVVSGLSAGDVIALESPARKPKSDEKERTSSSASAVSPAILPGKSSHGVLHV